MHASIKSARIKHHLTIRGGGKDSARILATAVHVYHPEGSHVGGKSATVGYGNSHYICPNRHRIPLAVVTIINGGRHINRDVVRAADFGPCSQIPTGAA